MSQKRKIDDELNSGGSVDSTQKMEEKGQDSQVSIEDLPTEMLQMVLRNLSVSSLFACHVVSQKWNELANYILHDRSEAELQFEFNPDTKQYQLIVENEKNEEMEMKDGKSAQDFLLECVNQSENSRFRSSPFARFALINIQKWDESIINFLSAVSPTAACLKLQFSRSVIEEDSGFTEKLRNLLLHETPKLKELGLGFEKQTLDQNQMENSKKDSNILKLTLFPSPPKENSKDPTSIKLPKLKELEIGLDVEDDITIGIFRDILRIAPNLELINYFEIGRNNMGKWYFGHEDLMFFLECGKLHTLKNVTFDPTPKFLSNWKSVVQKLKINIKEISSLFKIGNLELDYENLSRINNPSDSREAVQLAEQILEGSKNTLKTLYISDLQFPPGFTFPTFTKLLNVELTVSDVDQETQETLSTVDSLFPPGCRLLNIFSTVRTLSLSYGFSSYLKNFFPREDCTPVMPSVHTIVFEGDETKGEDVEVMALLCPNVKKLKLENENEKDKDDIYIGGVGLMDFPSFGLAVWKNMKNLESLDLIIDAGAEANEFPAMDSTMTGISKENCIRLYEESTNADIENLDDDDENSTAKLQRETELQGLKVNLSIWDLPKLKELNIRLQSKCKDVEEDFDAVAYKICIEEGLSQLSRVSALYAFKLMPGLKYEITGEAYC